jgi:hypothetical protein
VIETEMFPYTNIDDREGLWSGQVEARLISAGQRRERAPALQGKHDALEGTQSGVLRRRRALAMTDTELKLIAALAIIGLRSQRNIG